MKARIAAWTIVLLICGAIWQYGSRWKNPLHVVGSPVLSQLPAAGKGCDEACNK